MQKRFTLLLIGAFTVLAGLASAPGAFAGEEHPDCNRLGLTEDGVYPPGNKNPSPGDIGTWDLTFQPETALSEAKIAGKVNGPPWTGALLCGTDEEYNGGQGKYFYKGTITSAPGPIVHCTNPGNTSRYCEGQVRWGAVACKGVSSGVGLCKTGIALPADDILDGKFGGRGQADLYCTSPDILCSLLNPRVQANRGFKSFIDYDTSDSFPGGYGDRCGAEAIACYEARTTIFGTVECNSDTIVTRNAVDPRRVDLTIYPTACDSNIGKDIFLMGIDSFNLCQYAGEWEDGIPFGSYKCGEDLRGGPDETLWMQTNGWPGEWTYSVDVEMVDGERNPIGITKSGDATGVWS